MGSSYLGKPYFWWSWVFWSGHAVGAQRTKSQVKQTKWCTVEGVLNSTKKREMSTSPMQWPSWFLVGQTQRSRGMSCLGAVWNWPGESFEQLAGLSCLRQEFGQEDFSQPKICVILVNYCFVCQWWICVTLGRSWSFSAPVLISFTALTALLCSWGAKYCKVYTQLLPKSCMWGCPAGELG